MEYTIRELAREDLTQEYFRLLSGLTEAPFPNENAVSKRFEFISQNRDTYTILVAVSPENKIAASGTLLIEKKFIRNLGSIGHIEDIVVSSNSRGAGLGKKIILSLLSISKKSGCYKTILACSRENEEFYKKCGFVRKELEMAVYHT